MDWGQLNGLNALYSSPSKREAATQELATLQILSQEVKAKKAQEEQDQLKVAEYKQKVQEFSDSLLGPDRDKINEKARILGGKIKESLMMHGGDYTKFIQSGGHKVMSDYKTELVSSPESTIYLENKKNSDLINQVVLAGKGHLLTQRDIMSLEAYKNNNGGKITYSGLMSEIEMPDANRYDYGTIIPAEDILRNKSNYLAIYGNYKLTHPDSGEPTEVDLINFINANYRELGSGTVRADQAHRQSQAEFSNAIALENLKINQRQLGIQEAEAMYRMSGGGTTSSSRGGGTSSTGGKVPEDKSTRTEFVPNTVRQLFNEISGKTAEDWGTAFEGSEKWKMVKSGMPKWNETSYGFNPDEKGAWIDRAEGNNAFNRAITSEYLPRNGYQLFSTYNPVDFAKHAFGLDDTQIDRANRSIMNITPRDDWFWGDGANVRDLNVDNEVYSGNFKVKAIITGGTVTNNETGNKSIVMDGKNPKDTEKLNALMKGSEVTPGAFAVMENEDGFTFYAPIPLSGSESSYYMEKLMQDPNLASLNVAQSTMDMEVKENRANFSDRLSKEMAAQTVNFYNATSLIPNSERKLTSESMHYSPTGDASFRNKLIKSFYASSLAPMGLEGDDLMLGYETSLNQGEFGIFVSKMKQLGYTNIVSDMKSGYNDTQIINKIAQVAKQNGDSETANFANLWLNSHKDLLKIE